ncbi:MAG: tetratricopeptide repeat protein [Minwuia sp.]|uniref:tetratricopeptide repeat protein n=1 Tax=Minwuia sp. TaxID=2493630 RepID=UPI003A85DE68
MRVLAAVFCFILIADVARANDMQSARTALGNGDFETAIYYLTEAIRTGDTDGLSVGEIYYERGLAKGRLGRNDEALADYRQAVQSGFRQAGVFSSICYTLSDRLDRQDEALPNCNEALRIDPYHAPTYGIRALVWWKRDNITEAEKDFDHAISLDPSNWGNRYNRGNMYHSLGRHRACSAGLPRLPRPGAGLGPETEGGPAAGIRHHRLTPQTVRRPCRRSCGRARRSLRRNSRR